MKKLIFVFTLLICCLGCEKESNGISGSIVGERRLTDCEESITMYSSTFNSLSEITYNNEPEVVSQVYCDSEHLDTTVVSIIFTYDGKLIKSSPSMFGGSENYTFGGSSLTMDDTTSFTSGDGQILCEKGFTTVRSNKPILNNYVHSIYKRGKTREERINRGYESTIQDMMCSFIFW